MQSQAGTAERLSEGLVIREAEETDAERLGQIFFDAFESIATRHAFPTEPGSPEFTAVKVAQMLASDGIVGLVAETGDDLLASAFVDERANIAGIGPITVDPAAQDQGLGRALLQALLERERQRGVAGVRLVQTAYHYRSLALYAKLGFAVQEPLSVVQGEPPALVTPGLGVRGAQASDVPACAQLCTKIHGFERANELQEAIAVGTARVVENAERLTGYATGLGYGWHAVAESNDDLIALLSSAPGFIGLGILVPSRNAGLLHWCLEHGLRIVQQSTLMTIGSYSQPAGVWLPSVVY